jgi:hypothetical protein
MRVSLLVVVSLCVTSGAARAQPEPAAVAAARVLVVPCGVDAAVPVTSETCNAVLAARVSKVPTVSIVTQEELSTVANYQASLQGLGEDDLEGLLALGRMAQADMLVRSTLGQVGDTVTATLVLINVKDGTVEKRWGGTAKGEAALILPLLNSQGDALLAHLLRTYAPHKLGTRPAATAPVAPAALTPAPTRPLWAAITIPALLALSAGLAGAGLATVLTGGLAVVGAQVLFLDARSTNGLTFGAVMLGACAVGVLGVVVGVAGLGGVALIHRLTAPR